MFIANTQLSKQIVSQSLNKKEKNPICNEIKDFHKILLTYRLTLISIRQGSIRSYKITRAFFFNLTSALRINIFLGCKTIIVQEIRQHFIRSISMLISLHSLYRASPNIN